MFKSTDATDDSGVCNEKTIEMEWGPEEAVSNEEQSDRLSHQQDVSENSEQCSSEKRADEQSKKDLKILKKKKSSKKMKNKVRLYRLFSLKCTLNVDSFGFSKTKF